ncbi:MAG: response regulator [Methanomicrobiales archaeon]|nr:response regulator [Methanomicrobiales archaeon]
MTHLQIVIVEDDPILCDLLKIRLTKMGYSITGMYATGEDAIRAISEYPPDLAIMDISLLGKMDGIETAQQIHKNYPIPVVYLTGSSDPKTFERAITTEGSEFVIKPFSDSDLHIAIEMSFHKYGQHREIQNKLKFLEGIFRFVEIGIVATDREGAVIFANHCAESLAGYHFNSSNETHICEMLTITGEEGHQVEDMLGAIRTDLVVRDLPEHAVLVAAGGEKIHVRGTVSPLADENGLFNGIIVAFSPLARPDILRFS